MPGRVATEGGHSCQEISYPRSLVIVAWFWPIHSNLINQNCLFHKLSALKIGIFSEVNINDSNLLSGSVIYLSYQIMILSSAKAIDKNKI